MGSSAQTVLICHLCQKHALILYVVGYHVYAWSSEDILAVITDELSQQQEAEFNAVEGCCKTRLKDRFFCHGILPYLQQWIETLWCKAYCIHCTLCRLARCACSCSIKHACIKPLNGCCPWSASHVVGLPSSKNDGQRVPFARVNTLRVLVNKETSVCRPPVRSCTARKVCIVLLALLCTVYSAWAYLKSCTLQTCDIAWHCTGQ